LSQCEGNCDADSDCKDGMVCFQRQAGGGVPGCAGNPHYNYNYCIRKEDRATTPPSVQTTPTPTTLLPSTVPTTINKRLCVPLQYISADPSDLLSQCQGHCDADSDCKDGMVCFHRETGGGVPGCAGNPFSDSNYCIREEDRTPIETVYFFGGSKRITQSVDGQPDAVVINPPTDYSLKFTIEPKDVIDSSGSIIHFTTGGNGGRYSLWPAIFLYAHTTKMQVYTGDNYKDDRYHDLPYQLELHKKHSIEVHVYGTKSSIYVNGNLAAQMTIGPRVQLDQVNVYIGDPWHKPANAVISDISFTEAVDNTPTFVSNYFYSGSQLITRSVDGQPDAVVINPPTDYSLRFTIEPKGYIDDTGSIILFTTGGNGGQYGQRVPGIWFLPSTTRFKVYTYTDSDGDIYYTLPYELELNKKHSIEVHVYGTKSSVYVNGALAYQKTIGTRTQLEQVNVYIGQPWNEPANATISDISFTEAVDNTPTFVSDYFYSGSLLIPQSVDDQPDAVVINPPTDYSLRFTIEPKGVIDNWGSIMKISTNSGTYGKRVPAIFFRPRSTQLHISINSVDSGETQHNLPELELNKKHSIEVHVYGTKSSVYVNGNLAETLPIGTRMQLDQVNVYIGNEEREPANAVISDISFTEAVDNTPTFVSNYFYSGSQLLPQSVDGQPDAVVINPPTDYSLRFTIEPKGVVGLWGSIIRIGTNSGTYGERVPAIFFRAGTTRLHISINSVDSGETQHNLPELELNKKHSIEVHVYGTKSSVYVNGKLAETRPIGTRAQLDQVKVYIGDGGEVEANAVISDISFTEAVEYEF